MYYFTQHECPETLVLKDFIALAKSEGVDYIVLYKGTWNDWRPHPQGVVIRIGDRFLLNGETLLDVGEWHDCCHHPKGAGYRLSNQFWLDHKTLLYEGKWNDWSPHLEGIVIEIDDELRLYFGSG